MRGWVLRFWSSTPGVTVGEDGNRASCAGPQRVTIATPSGVSLGRSPVTDWLKSAGSKQRSKTNGCPSGCALDSSRARSVYEQELGRNRHFEYRRALTLSPLRFILTGKVRQQKEKGQKNGARQVYPPRPPVIVQARKGACRRTGTRADRRYWSPDRSWRPLNRCRCSGIRCG